MTLWNDFGPCVTLRRARLTRNGPWRGETLLIFPLEIKEKGLLLRANESIINKLVDFTIPKMQKRESFEVYWFAERKITQHRHHRPDRKSTRLNSSHWS